MADYSGFELPWGPGFGFGAGYFNPAAQPNPQGFLAPSVQNGPGAPQPGGAAPPAAAATPPVTPPPVTPPSMPSGGGEGAGGNFLGSLIARLTGGTGGGSQGGGSGGGSSGGNLQNMQLKLAQQFLTPPQIQTPQIPMAKPAGSVSLPQSSPATASPYTGPYQTGTVVNPAGVGGFGMLGRYGF